jgi:hypothetical protein
MNSLNPHAFRKMDQAQQNMKKRLQLTRRSDGGSHSWHRTQKRITGKAQRRGVYWARLFSRWCDKLVSTQ